MKRRAATAMATTQAQAAPRPIRCSLKTQTSCLPRLRQGNSRKRDASLFAPIVRHKRQPENWFMRVSGCLYLVEWKGLFGWEMAFQAA